MADGNMRMIVEVQDGGYVLDAEPFEIPLKLAEQHYPREVASIVSQPPEPPEDQRPGEDDFSAKNRKNWQLYDRLVAEHKRRVKEVFDPIKLQRCHGRTAKMGRGFYAVVGKGLDLRKVILPDGEKAPETTWEGPFSNVLDAKEARAAGKAEKAGMTR